MIGTHEKQWGHCESDASLVKHFKLKVGKLGDLLYPKRGVTGALLFQKGFPCHFLEFNALRWRVWGKDTSYRSELVGLALKLRIARKAVK